MSDRDPDVIVIGGGVNGTGVARDCAMRGLRVALLERNDLGFGASGNNSGMIHGGVRYLTTKPNVTRLSCLDSGFIQRIAPHLLFRIPFIMSVERRLGSRAYFMLVDAFFGAYDKFQPLKRGKPHTRLSPDETRKLEPGITADLVGAVTFDEWGIDGARLCAANAVDAHARGASIRVHTTVEAIERDPEHADRWRVRWRDRFDGATGVLSGRVVVNATGAWAPITASLAGLETRSAPVRPGKGIHIVFDRRISNYAVAVQAIDNRQVFIEPWQNVSVLGTTDTDYYGDLDNVFATSDEVRYLMQAMARVMPSIRTARIIGTYAGIRPTLYAWGPIPDVLSREHEIIDHGKHARPGLYSMVGGKLASYRVFAQEMTDRIAPTLGFTQPCATHTTALPGGDREVDPRQIAACCGIDGVAARRLVYRHGSRALEIAELMRENPVAAIPVCSCEAISEAEIRFVVRHEFARTIDDVSRRTRLGCGPCGGMHCALRAAAIVASERGDDARSSVGEAVRFLQRMSRTRTIAMGPIQARQEALGLAALRSQVGLGPAREND